MSAIRRFGILSGAIFLLALGDVQAQGKTFVVRIERGRLVPAQLSAETGDIVVWENHDTRPHRLRRSDGGEPALDSGMLRPGKVYSFRVRGATSIPYECRLDPEMRGTIDIYSK